MSGSNLGSKLGGRIARTAPMLAALAALVLLTACSTTPRGQTEENWMEYLNRLRLLEETGAGLEEGSEEALAAIERFQDLLSDFKAPDFGDRVAEVYAEDVFFNDTIKTVHGAVEEHGEA